MMNRTLFALFLIFSTSLSAMNSWALTESSVSGTIVDDQGISVPNVPVQLIQNGKVVKEVTSTTTGDYDFFPVEFGDYQISIKAPGFPPFQTTAHVSSGGTTQVPVQLNAQSAVGQTKEMVMEVKVKRKLVQSAASVSSTEINKEQISTLPQGGEIPLPRLLATTNPGVVQGPFGQTFFRGNHANIQYQIDGVQLPDSPSNTFGQAFSPRNIDHMEVITGGIPAEYGERLAAVVNIITKSGSEKPQGEIELNYGSYNATSPHILYGGSNESGSLHYFVSANYNQTNRGLDTPQPVSDSNQLQGGEDSVHNFSSGNNEFMKIDWLPNNTDKVSFIVFNAESNFQIPNYPCSFKSTDAFFGSTFVDQFGNQGDNGNPIFNWTPCNTNDSQFEANAYAQVVWKHTFSDHAFMQLAPYYKYSAIQVSNDPVNDLAAESSTSPGSTQTGASPISGSTPSSFAENRHVNNLGLKGDVTLRPDDRNLVKTGFQFQASRSEGAISIQTDLGTPPVSDTNPDDAYFVSAYLQDDFTIIKPLILNVGFRYDATQFIFAGASPFDSLLQPRIGLNYLLTDTTKLHVFYGKLFQPAPVENLRDTFIATGAGACPAGQLCPYDIKAEKDDYWEIGIAQQFIGTHVALLNLYYKDGTNMLDDAQLLNTSIAQPYNYSHGFAYGVELSVKGQLNEDWSDYINYSYEIAMGEGISGGIFTGVTPGAGYQFLDHVQIHTANAGVTYAKNYFWWTTQGLFGSGLRTGSNNSVSLPSHFSADTTVGYTFHGDSWLTRFKLSADVLNILDNPYPITVANGFNGSHYAAGRLFWLRLSKEI